MEASCQLRHLLFQGPSVSRCFPSCAAGDCGWPCAPTVGPLKPSPQPGHLASPANSASRAAPCRVVGWDASHVSHTPAACSFPGENTRSWEAGPSSSCVWNPRVFADDSPSAGEPVPEQRAPGKCSVPRPGSLAWGDLCGHGEILKSGGQREAGWPPCVVRVWGLMGGLP